MQDEDNAICTENILCNLSRVSGLSLFSAGYGAAATSVGAGALLFTGKAQTNNVAFAQAVGAGAAGYATLLTPILIAAAMYFRYSWHNPLVIVLLLLLYVFVSGLAGIIGAAELGYRGDALAYIATSSAIGGPAIGLPFYLTGRCCDRFFGGNNDEIQPARIESPERNNHEMQPASIQTVA